MLRKTLTIFSLIGLLLSGGLWGVSYWNVYVAIDRSSTYVVVAAGHGGLRIDVAEYPSRNVEHRTTWAMGGFEDFKTSIVGPWINNNGNGTSAIIPLPFFAFLFGSIFVYCALPFHRHRKRKRLGLCVKCGYDLRASKDRCPECGSEFEHKEPERQDLPRGWQVRFLGALRQYSSLVFPLLMVALALGAFVIGSCLP